jgi:hypothetical protein
MAVITIMGLLVTIAYLKEVSKNFLAYCDKKVIIICINRQ